MKLSLACSASNQQTRDLVCKHNPTSKFYYENLAYRHSYDSLLCVHKTDCLERKLKTVLVLFLMRHNYSMNFSDRATCYCFFSRVWSQSCVEK